MLKVFGRKRSHAVSRHETQQCLPATDDVVNTLVETIPYLPKRDDCEFLYNKNMVLMKPLSSLFVHHNQISLVGE